MMDKIKAALTCLGFLESVKAEKMPKLSVITKKYHKLALAHHPDRKNGDGDEERFKEITEAYRLIGEHLEEMKENEGNATNAEETFDFEEEVARRTFKEFQFAKVKENMRSFTIHIENELSFTWDIVLSKHYGDPHDRKENGQHWKVVDYTDGILTGNISISKWHIPKRDKQTKLHIQSNEKGNFLPAHFIDNVLPKLLEEVHKHQDLGLSGPSMSPADKKENAGVEVKTKPSTFKCKLCEFTGKNLSSLSTHSRLTHNKKDAKASGRNSKQASGNSHSISMEHFSVKFNMNEIEEIDPETERKNLNLDKSSPKEENEKKPTENLANHEVSNRSNKPTKLPVNNLKPILVNKSVKDNPDVAKAEKKRSKNKSTGFTCKHCENKFETLLLLSSHMKTCHTKNDVPDVGNGITFNSPCLQVKHFFCTCALCGEGYDDYSQLSKHESEQHNFKCNSCEEGFMVETELTTHIATEHVSQGYPCDICDKVYTSKEIHEQHMIMKHKETRVESMDTPTQTDTFSCENCLIRIGKTKHFDTLQKEHIELLELYERQKSICSDQLQNIQKQNEQIVVFHSEKQEHEKEVSRLKKLNAKNEKASASKINELKSKVEESYKAVDKYAQENTKLAEEKKMLEEILEINQMHSEITEAASVEVEIVTDTAEDEGEENEEIEVEIYDLEDNEPDDDEVIAFYLQQNVNRAKRTGPMEQPTLKKQNTTPQSKKNLPFKCDLCDFTAKTQININLHKEAQHKEVQQKSKTCSKCDFRYKTNVQLEKHIKVAHSNSEKTCWFWENDFCARGNSCRFSHKTFRTTDGGPRITPCWYQNNCRKPGCPFGHMEEMSFLSQQNPRSQRSWRN